MDSGSSCGEISGHAKPINALSVRHQRPFRAISGSDDNLVNLHTAVPFKYKKMISTHSRIVRDVAYSPDGDTFASVGSDGKVILYDGKTGETKGEMDRGGLTSSLVRQSLNGKILKKSLTVGRWHVLGILTRQSWPQQAQMVSSLSVSDRMISKTHVDLSVRGCIDLQNRANIFCWL